MPIEDLEPGGDGPSVMIVGIDGSDTSWRAMYYTLGLARRQHSTVTAVFAFPMSWTCQGMPSTSYEDGVKLAAELECTVKGLADDYHVTTHFIWLMGCDPVLTLGRIAAEQRADAIVIGASQALCHRFFGSTALRSVRRGQCPVIVVP